MPKLKLTILQRLALSYLMILALVAGAGVYGIANLNHLNRIITQTNVDSRMIRLADECSLALYSEESAAEKYLISGDPDYRRQFVEIHADFNKKMAEFQAIASLEEQKVLLQEINTLHLRYYAPYIEMSKPTGKKSARRADDLRRAGDRTSDEIDAKLRTLSGISVRERDAKLQQSGEASTRVVRVFTMTGVIALLAVILISILMTKAINAPIKRLRDRTKQIAKGDFGTPMQIASPPEIREFNDAFNLMCERLQESDQMKQDFINHLSHELRTPLTAIKEASCMLQEGIFAEMPEKQQGTFLHYQGRMRPLDQFGQPHFRFFPPGSGDVGIFLSIIRYRGCS